MLKVKKLEPDAKLPICAHPGEDLGYDIFSVEDVTLWPGVPTKVRTGIAVELPGYGFLIRDRSSMASKGVMVSGGVVDAGYRGEITVVLTNIIAVEFETGPDFMSFLARKSPVVIQKGDKIAQMVPIKPETWCAAEEVELLSMSRRGAGGFGSTGK